MDRLAEFTVSATSADISASAGATLKRNVLDSIACAVGALDGEPIGEIRAHATQFSSTPTATIVGGGRLSVDQATFFNTVLVRYPDLLDTFLTEGGLCHPADNFGGVLAVAEHAGARGSEFLLALAVAYEIQCRFSAQVPVMARGLNHALQLAMSTSAASSKLLGLGAGATADAIAAATVDNVSLAAVHAEPVAMWKGISPAVTAMRAVYVTFLAARGVTGPRAVFDGSGGLDQLLDRHVDFDTADRDLDAVEQTYLKQYCSLIHGQAVIDAALQIRTERGLSGRDVDHVVVEVFQGAYDFAGGGSYGDKSRPWTKEQADYNLKYLVAVALLDGAVGPAQLETERVRRADVQDLLTRVRVVAADDLTAAYPRRTSVRVGVTTREGAEYHRHQADFEGAPTRPMSWERVVEKFEWLAEPFCDATLRREIVTAVDTLDTIEVSELTGLLGAVRATARGPRTRHRL
ncbi:MmgE/PrpD family protein [Mycobacterium yunnanensis]|uniref:MmgE/PrpD family protein n=1 Tax=Mycobacterium yunnanensis TaxID=368477 RepID=A0A9X2ZAV7_9MYCO|nr:MmgE/PrpD family protein [Mycobacterium yunnanensis]